MGQQRSVEIPIAGAIAGVEAVITVDADHVVLVVIIGFFIEITELSGILRIASILKNGCVRWGRKITSRKQRLLHPGARSIGYCAETSFDLPDALMQGFQPFASLARTGRYNKRI